jgi:hypothetical protein
MNFFAPQLISIFWQKTQQSVCNHGAFFHPPQSSFNQINTPEEERNLFWLCRYEKVF